VAVLPLQGTLVPRADIMTEYSGGTSLEKFKNFLRAALEDPNVAGIVLDIDSPGGSVYGTEEAAEEVYEARGQKPIVAFANPMAASAAYWIGSQADEIVVTPSGEVGSIGVLALHEDWSRAYDASGVTPTFISAGKFKTEGNELEPLGEEAKAALQSRVDDYYEAFVRAVARGRGMRASDVRSGFGEGRLVGAEEAVKLGMADREGTIDDAIARASRPAASKRAEGASVAVMQKQVELWEASAPK
jgi:signal peptide peptidase SppA